MLGELLTIVVPTFNRYPFLARLLKYYRECRVRLRMVILDSSESDVRGEAGALIDAEGITYRKYPSTISPIEKLSEGLSAVATPFVVLWADDDLMVPGALVEAAAFLEQHQDVSAVTGHTGFFYIDPANQPMSMTRLEFARQRAYDESTARGRLTALLGDYTSLFYAVQRTEHLKAHLAVCCQHEFGYCWGELALASLAVVQGKVAKLNKLYMLRDTHDARDSWNDSQAESVFDWVVSATFADRYERFIRCLTQAVAERDGIDGTEARMIAKEAFWSYLAKVIARTSRHGHESKSDRMKSRVRNAVGKVPALLQAIRETRAWIHGDETVLSPPALFQRRSPFHADFMPMYKAITSQEAVIR